ncbi:hypothetical protein CEV34_4765 [Brucella pseudogrignonensis]|jgi:hypothetical protein|uniref:Uncharacterized protein n=1 Tax=Brucella pseudogrignonensis TaxID=419475 RepID=A0A256G4E7_9HYPH|nr:hypothetical protein CEV34_4765 [Brucella pseudogrignonensis]
MLSSVSGFLSALFSTPVPAIETGTKALNCFLNTLIDTLLQAALLAKYL